MTRPSLRDHPVYSIYTALDSGTLLALLPELDHWHERYLGELRIVHSAADLAPEQGAAVTEVLNEARAAWHGQLDKNPQDVGGIEALLGEIDKVKLWHAEKESEAERSSQTQVRRLSVVLTDILRRRSVAVLILAERGLLPADLARD